MSHTSIAPNSISNATGGGVNASQTVSLNKRCQNVILQSACLPTVRENVLVPILEYLAREAEPKRTLRDDPINVMWHIARQGALLCELLNQCQPGVIPSVSFPIAPMGSTNFSDTNSRQNVATFIKSSRDMFFYTDEFLFNPGDLYRDDFNALTKAVTLCEKYLENKIRVSSRNSYRVNDLVLGPEIAPLFDTAAQRNSVEKVNRRPDGPSKRDRILEEMIASERIYVDDLDRLNKYKETLKFFKLLPQTDLDSIFSNLKDLLNFQRRFMIEMESQIEKDRPDFAGLFTTHEADFSLYEIFCLNQPSSLLTLAKNKMILESRPDLSENLSGNVQGYLIKPVQRVPRYHLFLRDLIKDARKQGNEVEAKNFEVAAESARRVANRINERQRTAENEVAAKDFFEQFHPVIMNPQKTGKLVLFDKAVRLKLDKELKVHQVYLFQKKLIMCAEKKEKIMGKFWIKSKVSTDSIKDVKDLPSNDLETPFEAEITCVIPEKEDMISFSLLFRTQHTQRMWIDAIRGIANIPALEYSGKEADAESEAVVIETPNLKDILVVPEMVEPCKCQVRFMYREEYFSFVITGTRIGLTEFAEAVREEIERSFRLESQSVRDIPPVDRIRLRYKDFDGITVRISNDQVIESLLREHPVLNLIVFEGEPIRVRFAYRECMYTFTVDDISALEELKIYVYETIAEDYRMINANMEAVPKGDAMRLFYKEVDGEWSLLLYDNDLEVALKLSNRCIDLKF